MWVNYLSLWSGGCIHTVVCKCVQTWARTSEISRAWWYILVTAARSNIDELLLGIECVDGFEESCSCVCTSLTGLEHLS